MTRREIKVCKALLKFLHDLDGGQVVESILHAGVIEITGETVSLGDFNAAMAICDTRGWCVVVPSKFHGMKRSISDAGEGALAEM